MDDVVAQQLEDHKKDDSEQWRKPTRRDARWTRCCFGALASTSVLEGTATCGRRPGSTEPPSRFPYQRLFRRFAIELLIVCLRVCPGMVDHAIPMIRGRIERIELQRNTPGIDDVVLSPSGDDDGKACLDRRPNAIENRLTRARLHTKELVELVYFLANFFTGFQGHQDELAVFGRIKHATKLAVLEGERLDILDKSFHNTSFVLHRSTRV